MEARYSSYRQHLRPCILESEAGEAVAKLAALEQNPRLKACCEWHLSTPFFAAEQARGILIDASATAPLLRCDCHSCPGRSACPSDTDRLRDVAATVLAKTVALLDTRFSKLIVAASEQLPGVELKIGADVTVRRSTQGQHGLYALTREANKQTQKPAAVHCDSWDGTILCFGLVSTKLGTPVYPDAVFASSSPVKHFLDQSRTGNSVAIQLGDDSRILGACRPWQAGTLVAMPACTPHSKPDEQHSPDPDPAIPRWFSRCNIRIATEGKLKRTAGGRQVRLALALLVAEHVWGDLAFVHAACMLSQVKQPAKMWMMLAKEHKQRVAAGVYQGEMKGGQRHGHGRCDYPSGDVYEGEWVEGKRQGQGRGTFNGGRRQYTGAWENDVRHGLGTYIKIGEWSFTGIFEHGAAVDREAFARARGEGTAQMQIAPALSEGKENDRQAVQVARRSGLTYTQFWTEYMLPNKPVIITDAVTAKHGWHCLHSWATSGGLPDFRQLAAVFGEASAPVVDCGATGEYSTQEQKTTPVSDFLGRWEKEVVSDTEGQEYLKDWHCSKELPHVTAAAYRTPEVFGDDWLNWWCDDRGIDDFRFVYMGKKGTWTPMHHDVLCSFSWSVNVCGLKRWILFPPSLSPCLYAEPPVRDDESEAERNVRAAEPFDGDEIDGYLHGELLSDIRRPATGSYPHWKRAYDSRIEVLQRSGEAIFVPSGWHHQVHNLQPTISINHNWFNAACLQRIWRFLKTELMAVRREIAHLRQDMNRDEAWAWERQCEMLMKANSGFNLEEFVALLRGKAAEIRQMLAIDAADTARQLPHEVLRHGLSQVAAVFRDMARDEFARECVLREGEAAGGNAGA